MSNWARRQSAWSLPVVLKKRSDLSAITTNPPSGGIPERFSCIRNRSIGKIVSTWAIIYAGINYPHSSIHCFWIWNLCFPHSTIFYWTYGAQTSQEWLGLFLGNCFGCFRLVDIGIIDSCWRGFSTKLWRISSLITIFLSSWLNTCGCTSSAFSLRTW